MNTMTINLKMEEKLLRLGEKLLAEDLSEISFDEQEFPGLSVFLEKPKFIILEASFENGEFKGKTVFLGSNEK